MSLCDIFIGLFQPSINDGMVSNNVPLFILIIAVVIALIYYYRFKLFRGFYSTPKPPFKRVVEVRENINEGIECPKCGNKMNKGYLVSSGRIRWVEHASPRRVEGFSDIWRNLGLDRSPEPFASFNPEQPFGIEAYKCRHCGFIWIDESRLLPF